MEKFVVSYSPFIRSSNDINKMFILTSIALVLPAVYGCIFFGYNALFVILMSVGACYFSEFLFNLISIHKPIVTDFSFLVTGLILGLTLPIGMPLYIVVISAFFADFVVKMIFGGLGENIFNPALVGRLFAGLFVSDITGEFYKLTMKGENFISFTLGGENGILNLLTGKSVGGIGTTCIIVILICYAFLVYSSVIDWKIPLISVLSYFIVSYFVCGMENALLNICSGSFIFVSVFMMTDPNVSPDNFLGKIIYCILFGGLSAYLWNIGKLGEDTVFVAALFVNMLVPFMNKYLVIRQKPLGGFRYAYKN